MKKYLMETGIIAGSFLLIPLVFSIFNLFEIEIPSIVYLVCMATVAFISGILVGFNTKNNAYRRGLLLGGGFIIVMLIISLILRTSINFNIIIFYLIILISSTLGSMVGIQKR